MLSDWGNHEKARGALGYLPRVPLILLPKFTFRERQRCKAVHIERCRLL